MKKLLIMMLALALVFAFAACAPQQPAEPDPEDTPEDVAPVDEGPGIPVDQIKVGHIHINDEAEQGYSTAHINGVKGMAAALGLKDDQLIGKYNISEDGSCETAIRELVEAGCNIIFADSFGFEDYMLECAAEFPDVLFCHATGYQAATSGLDNMANYFGNIYEARYLTGIVAGMATQSNKLGYVTAQEFAECVSGLTAFYLGAKSVNEAVTMDIMFTNTWFDVTLEAQAAQALIDGGADVLGQHADSASTQTTAEAAGKYGVGYNMDMSTAAPKANLCSAVWDWTPAYIHFVEAAIAGEELKDFSGGLADGMVDIAFNDELLKTLDNYDAIMAAVEEARTAIKNGTLHVFDINTFTVGGAKVESTKDLDGYYGVEYISDGYFHESEYSSAPSFFFIVDGVTVKR